MTPEMQFECLLVSRDPALYCTFTKVLRNFSIVVDHELSSSKASEVIAKGTHDLVVIDWEGEASSELLHGIWHLRNKKKPTTLAISGEGRSIPGAHVALRKPVTLQSGTESLKLAYARMLLDYRISARHALMAQVSARDESGRNFPIIVTDIGDSGIGLKTNKKIEVGNVLSLTLLLPQTPLPVHMQARVVWIREYGTAGCEIVTMPPVDRDILRDWLKAKTRVKQPLIPVECT